MGDGVPLLPGGQNGVHRILYGVFGCRSRSSGSGRCCQLGWTGTRRLDHQQSCCFLRKDCVVIRTSFFSWIGR